MKKIIAKQTVTTKVAKSFADALAYSKSIERPIIHFSSDERKALQKQIMERYPDKIKKLKDQLEAIWTICPAPGEKKEYDRYVDMGSMGSTEAGATRNPYGNATGTEVRIKFTQPKGDNGSGIWANSGNW